MLSDSLKPYRSAPTKSWMPGPSPGHDEGWRSVSQQRFPDACNAAKRSGRRSGPSARLRREAAPNSFRRGLPPGEAGYAPAGAGTLSVLARRSRRSAGLLRASAIWPSRPAEDSSSAGPRTAASSSSAAARRFFVSASSSTKVSAAMTWRRMSPISPKEPRSSAIFASKAAATPSRWASSPSPPAMPELRPAIVPGIIGFRLSRSFSGRRGIGALEHVAHGADGAVHPPADIGGRGLHAGEPRAGALELDGKPGAVVLHDLQLGLEGAAAAFEIEPPPERRLERAERRLEPPHRIVERRHPTSKESVRED